MWHPFPLLKGNYELEKREGSSRFDIYFKAGTVNITLKSSVYIRFKISLKLLAMSNPLSKQWSAIFKSQTIELQ